MTHRERRSYDHRIKAQVAAIGDLNWFSALQIPRSTAMSWIRRGVGEVVVVEPGTNVENHHLGRFAKLEHRVSMLTAVLRLVLALLRVSGLGLDVNRIPNAEAQLSTIRRCRTMRSRARRLMRCTLDAARQFLMSLPGRDKRRGEAA